MRLVVGSDQEILEWASAVLGRPISKAAAVFGIVNTQETLCGAAIFTDRYLKGNIELTLIGKGCLQKGILKRLAEYCFKECGQERMTAKTRRGNVIARKLLPKA